MEAKADVNAKDMHYDLPLHARLKMWAQGLLYFRRFNSLVLVVETLRSIGLPMEVIPPPMDVVPMEVTSRFVDCSWRRKLT